MSVDDDDEVVQERYRYAPEGFRLMSPEAKFVAFMFMPLLEPMLKVFPYFLGCGAVYYVFVRSSVLKRLAAQRQWMNNELARKQQQNFKETQQKQQSTSNPGVKKK